ncbi:hypothetical protein CLNEO_18040 [Anaerotignum neopropionicum]|uniref:Uncharacterized protein n=1 Tax=Anaerotignum neopropionicum TaxID=36847 RepID=A0A136WE39_9FIRM|nr:hypothetical protein [Anaerotignum neopropionicum]KXL52782.1 hypothetical protein CLNEO_18040 [Anaerotignum neopropionicum]
MNVLNLSITQGKKKIKQIINTLVVNELANKFTSYEPTILDRKCGEII